MIHWTICRFNWANYRKSFPTMTHHGRVIARLFSYSIMLRQDPFLLAGTTTKRRSEASRSVVASIDATG